jgi:RNA polymerase sigma-70 factor (ECF subfamily)
MTVLYLSAKAPVQERALGSSGREAAQATADALAASYDEYYDRIARYAYARTGNRDVAEDLAGEVFVRAVESIDSFRDQGVPIGAWLFRIAHNLVIDHYRRSAKRRHEPLEEAYAVAGADDPAAETEHALAMEQVRASMALLNPAQQEVITLRFLGELSAEEAGAIMGRTPGAIRELQRTAMKALRAHMGAGKDTEEVR